MSDFILGAKPSDVEEFAINCGFLKGMSEEYREEDHDACQGQNVASLLQFPGRRQCCACPRGKM